MPRMRANAIRPTARTFHGSFPAHPVDAPENPPKSAAFRMSGRLAQLVEHLVYTERVGGSSPSAPTIPQFARQFSGAKLHANKDGRARRSPPPHPVTIVALSPTSFTVMKLASHTLAPFHTCVLPSPNVALMSK